MIPKIDFFKLWEALVSNLDLKAFFLDFAALRLGTFVEDFKQIFLKTIQKP